jgi:Flp pilus assembly protein TadG
MGEHEHLGRRGLSGRESGSDIVEFAVLLPVFALLLFGIVQYGLLFAAYITIRNASAAGARQAIISTDASNITAVAKASVGPLLDPNSLQVTPTPTNMNGRAGMIVNVSYPFKLIIPYIVPGRDANSNTRTITATTIIQ